MKWWIAGLLSLLVAHAGYANEMPRFLIGTWAMSCDPLKEGIAIQQSGKIVATDRTWGCLITKIEEKKLHWSDDGPSWTFVSKCDAVNPNHPSGLGKLSEFAHGTIALSFWDSFNKRQRIQLRLFVDRPSKPGERGLLALYPTDLYGPYDYCGN
jgi:hypothetical protein